VVSLRGDNRETSEGRENTNWTKGRGTLGGHSMGGHHRVMSGSDFR
jgi:hypothetical protein